MFYNVKTKSTRDISMLAQRAYLLLCCLFVIVACNEKDNGSDEIDITISTPSYNDLSHNSVSLSSTLNGADVSAVIKKGFCYSTQSEVDIFNGFIAEDRSSNANISVSVTGLLPNTVYYAIAFVTLENADPVYSAKISFQTKDKGSDEIDITLLTPSYNDMTYNSVILSSALNGADIQAVIKRGFCYSTQQEVDIFNSSTAEDRSSNATFSVSITDLSPNTIYYAKAFATLENADPVYSSEISFTTLVEPEPDLLAEYVAPAYVDNYTGMASWSQRNNWNLSNIHDPTVVFAEDGYFYMYQTDASYGNAHAGRGHFHARRSKDLVNWEYLGGTMPSLPSWVIPKLNEIRAAMGLAPTTSTANSNFGYWAPCVRKVQNGLYRMYYSIVCPGYIDGNNSWGERAFIGMMENTDPANNDGWVDKGYVVTNASDRGLNFYVSPTNWANCYFKWNAIDPSYIITPEGAHWLIYGSWHSGLVAMELNPSTGMPKQELGTSWATGSAPAEYGRLITTRTPGNRWQGSEGPEIVYNPETDYYYLFVAYDALTVPYNTRVARSKNITGPYLGINGVNVTTGGEMLPVVTHPYKFANSDGWVGISHCAIFDDGKGNWYYASQGRFPENVPGINVSNAIMMGHIRSIRWTKDGWPLVMPQRYGAVPQVPVKESELIGNWQHIDLSYSYGRQKESSIMTLSEDHKITAGAWQNGTWSYDEQNQILTVNGIDLYLQREVDWEATPRTHSIVYAGYTNQRTYWGKKSK